MPRPRKPAMAPSESRTARVARGRVSVTVVLSPAAKARLAAIAKARDWTMSDVVESAIMGEALL